MKIDNPLTREFLLQYPVDAARALEQVSADHVAALFSELPVQRGSSVMASMLPERAAACLGVMPAVSAAKLLTELPAASAARVYRLLDTTKQDELSAHLSEKTRMLIHRYLAHPPQSAGALLDAAVDMLPDNITVAEAMHRIERLDDAIAAEIYIIDDAHHLVGMIELGKLLVSNHHARLRDIMNRKTQPLSAHASGETLLAHPAWAKRRRLPVVERDNTLVGVLNHSDLMDSMGGVETSGSRDPLENLLSLAGLYWLSVAQLLDGLLNSAGSGKRGRQ